MKSGDGTTDEKVDQVANPEERTEWGDDLKKYHVLEGDWDI